MPEPYITEVQTAHWTSDGIREAFKAGGFEVREWPLTQHLEKQVPADAVFFSPTFSKLFGLQYKTVYRNREDFWPLDRTQHFVLQSSPWIYYCCSELTDAADHGLALYFARFYRPRFDFQAKLPVSGSFQEGPGYSRWGAFYRRLKACSVGARVLSQEQLRTLLAPFSGAARFREVLQMGEVLLADYEKRIVLADRLS
jgi:hypothetical protein